MPNTHLNSARNQSLECWKLAASVFVVFIHARFPGATGRLMDCLARFAVPMFFAISGYFSFRAGCGKTRKRLTHILKLNLISTAGYLLWNCFVAEYGGGGAWSYLQAAMQSPNMPARWILLHINPFAGHLWYLTAIWFCYLFLFVYIRCQKNKPADYRPFYCIGLALFVLYLLMDDVLPVFGIEIPFRYYRNGWFLGLPMFALGLFLHAFQEQICAKWNLSAGKLVWLLLAGAALSVLQWWLLKPSETPVGAYLEVIALLLLSAAHPELDIRSRFGEALIALAGSLSTMVYILHPGVITFYELFLQQRLQLLFPETEAFLAPVLTVLLSLGAGCLCTVGSRFMKGRNPVNT